jgi:hypothetical protein
MWSKLTTDNDIQSFMILFDYFHDSCIKEIRYTSGAYVDANLAMQPNNDKRIVNIIFQRQYKELTAIALRFMEIETLHLSPFGDDYTAEIFEATMFIKNGRIYWGDSANIKDNMNEYDGTWLCANRVEWRVIDECIGKNDVFVAPFDF